MVTLQDVAARPEQFTWQVQSRTGKTYLYRPLGTGDATALADLLGSLSPQTRRWWYSDSYDLNAARELCAAIARYDKLRMVAVAQNSAQSSIVGLFEFSFGLPAGDIERFAAYGLPLDETIDCRFGPCVREAYHRQGLASALMTPTVELARQFGKRRMILWGGVLADNEPAIAFYHAQHFKEVGRFQMRDGGICIDMLRKL